MYVDVYRCMYGCMYVYECIHVRMCVGMYMFMDVDFRAHVCIYPRMCICVMYVGLSLHVCVRV